MRRNRYELHVFFFYILTLAAVSYLPGGFGRKKTTRASFVELKEPPLLTTLWILDPKSGALVLQDGPIVRVKQAGLHTERNHYLRRKNYCLNHKDTKRNKQHFRFLYKKLFKATVFMSPQKKL